MIPGRFKPHSRLNENGGVMIEFAVMAPLLFLIFFAIIEWGSIFIVQNNMMNAARDAARTAAAQNVVTVTSLQNMTTANSNACKSLASTGSQYIYTIVSQDLCDSTTSTKQDVRVTVSMPATQASKFNYLGKFTDINLSNSARMRKDLPCKAVGAAPTCTCDTTVSPATCS